MGGEAVFWLWLLCDDCIGGTESLLVGQVMLGMIRMFGWLVGWLVGQVILGMLQMFG